ncbi:MAG: sigma 54-interacting transcriptional regulator [Myxococcota bacterium]
MFRETLQLKTAGLRVVRPLTIDVLEGPDQGTRYGPLTYPIRIGAAQGNEIILNDPSVSRHHCTIEETSEGIVVRDAGSTNGVWIGGHRSLAVLLNQKSRITLGRTVLQLVLGHGTPEPLPEEPSGAFGRLVGRSRVMRSFLSNLARVAPTKVSVLIEGETGTGKELAARALHEEGPKPDAPFVIVDFGATSPTLIESALFGHEKGAFTGADIARKGAFAEADGGTLFLDEVGELPLDLQPKLLRALESQTVTPLGSVTPVPFSVRVVAATHRNLRRMVNEGTFREDLYFRLAVCPVRMPALRERTEDIAVLARSIYLEALDLLEETPAERPFIEPAAEAWLVRQAWPGNVRELRNVILRSVILGDLEDVQSGRLSGPLERAVSENNGTPVERVSLEQAKRTFERAYLLELLNRHNGNRTVAAKEADIHVKSLQRLVRRYGLKDEVPK